MCMYIFFYLSVSIDVNSKLSWDSTRSLELKLTTLGSECTCMLFKSNE